MKFKIIIIFIAVNLAAILPLKAKIIEVEVRSGNTLHGFAGRYLKDPAQWPEIYELNKDSIKNPDIIYPQQKIKVPIEMLKDKVGDLMKIKEEVKIRKREINDWRPGELSERLFPEDGIMTGKKAYARVDFLVGSQLKVYADSLIYLKPTEKKTAVASLLEGGLNVRDAKVITPSAEIIPVKGANYDVGVDSEETTKVSVREGEVDVKAQGKTVTVIKGFRTLVEKGRVPQSPVVLPIDGEDALEFKEYRGDSLNVNFKLQVCENRNFDNLIKDEVTADISSEYIKKGLDPGQYYWRSAIIDKDGFTGDYSHSRSVYVSGKAEGFVELDKFEVINKEEGIMRISGYGKNIRSVSINGYPAELKSSGKFSATIVLNPGQKTITITSFGKSGVILRKYLRSSQGLWLPAK
jgi:hypothetical protein